MNVNAQKRLAASIFNHAKLYEDQGQFMDAANEFRRVFVESPEEEKSGLRKFLSTPNEPYLTILHPNISPIIYDLLTFKGKKIKETSLAEIDLSIEKYCGVMEMFRKFGELEIKTFFHHK